MKSVGIVVEYNPFHNGHKYHLEKVRDITGEGIVIGVMSGDYVQRGEPASFNRWDRAQMALSSGLDIIVELPVFYSTQNAEIFAKGALKILSELGVETLVFGSEAGNKELLYKKAELIETVEFKIKLKENLKKGLSYPEAYSETLKKSALEDNNNESNDILGLEYIKNGLKLGIDCIPVKRIGASYHNTDIVDGIASATGIREIIRENANYYEAIKKIIPSSSYDFIKNKDKSYKIPTLDEFYPLIRYEILNNFEKLTSIQDIEEGLENKIFSAAKKYKEFNDFYQAIKSKRYTQGRIQRVLIHILIGLTKDITCYTKDNLPYVRILGFNSKGQEYLKYLKKNRISNIEILTSLSNMQRDLGKKEQELLEFNERSSIIYKMVRDYQERKTPLIIK